MKMSPRNIVLFTIAIVVGVYLGLRFPLIGLLCLLVGVALVAYVLLSNKQGNEVDPTTRASALAITPRDGMARIYVARRGFVGGMQGMNITIDDTFNGQIRSGYFMMAEVHPGDHELSARFLAQTEGTRIRHTFNLAAGEAVLFEMNFDMGALQGKLRFDELRDKRAMAAALGQRKMIDWLNQPQLSTAAG